MTISAKVIEDSISEDGKRITTLQLTYPRFIHAEFMTHRVFSRNASSSRAIPVAKMIEQVRTDPAMPVHWGKNQPGMQAHEESAEVVRDLHLFGTKVNADVSVQEAWSEAALRAADVAEKMAAAGYHKQVVNRILEPFQHIHVVVTATEWENFFILRDHPDAQPEIRALAIAMREAMDASEPKLLKVGEWHLPYVSEGDWIKFEEEVGNPLGGKSSVLELAKKASAARCARVSYLLHDGTVPDVKKDLELYARLIESVPMHASPIEHQATPDFAVHRAFGAQRWSSQTLHGNFVGWMQNRKVIELAQEVKSSNSTN